MAKGIRFKKNNENAFVDKLYRVGDLYLTTNSENPSTIFGGTWELFGPGRTLVCVDTSQSEFNTVKKTGGSKTHTHKYGIRFRGWYGTLVEKVYIMNSNEGWDESVQVANSEKVNTRESTATQSNGAQWMTATSNTVANSSLQPFITCYIWIRTA